MNSKEIKKMKEDADRAQAKRDKLARIIKMIRGCYHYQHRIIDFVILKDSMDVLVVKHPVNVFNYLDVDIVTEVYRCGFTCYVEIQEEKPVLRIF